MTSVQTGERCPEGLLRSARRESDEYNLRAAAMLPLDSTRIRVLGEVVARRERGREGRVRALPKDSPVSDNVLLLGFVLGVDPFGSVQGIDREEREREERSRSEDETDRSVFRPVYVEEKLTEITSRRRRSMRLKKKLAEITSRRRSI